MITKLLTKIVGSKNERELKKLRPLVDQINALESTMEALSDEDFTSKTNEFRERIAGGESPDAVLPEAFALVREASKRTLGMRHFDVQLVGGIVLHQGKIAEMKTGEGKTLVATLPLYLNALTGKGAHLITVNDYLARRDAEWMGPIYSLLGLEVGVLQNSMDDSTRKQAYSADITYGTNNEFGFDYLRDNMKFNLDDYVQRPLHYAIVDEVDSILIDEARTPLIISGAAEKHEDLYQIANRAVQHLQKGEDYDLDEKARTVHLTEAGNEKLERALHVTNLYAPENIMYLHHAQQALKAHTLFRRDVDYVVRDGQVLIVDEFTGRILSGRRYSDGLHQAIEAKEGVQVERESQTLATITLQNYFRLYEKLSGMTGTAETEAGEFHNIYHLEVMVIPTNKPLIRDDQLDAIFLDKEDKFNAIIKDISSSHHKGQPVLVGTIAIETSEYLSTLLSQSGVPHNVLNAKQHAREADIVAEAGLPGKVTIATNMAGRGTDIQIGDEVKKVGGLRIVGTERHESRRIDNQLRGRAGRQGDPGSSKFYISLEDDLMRIFGDATLKNRMEKWGGMQKGDAIEHSWISRAIRKAQERVEKHNFDIRKNLLEYDDVLNQQRNVIYRYRHEILEGADQIGGLINDIIIDIINELIALYCPQRTATPEQISELYTSLHKLTGLDTSLFEEGNFNTANTDTLKNDLTQFLLYQYEQYRGQLPEDIINEAEKWILLETIDHAWRLNLQTHDKLKEGIHLRGYAQKNPVVEYKREAFFAFENMMRQIKWDIITRIFRLRPENFTASHIHEIESERKKELKEVQASHESASENTEQKTVRREGKKVGRNDPCPCGSGKKYKQCCLKK